MSILGHPLRIYTAVWDKKYIDLFEKTIIRSFSWAKNKEALQNEKVVWSFHAYEEDYARLSQLAKRIGVENISFTPLAPEIKEPKCDVGLYLLRQFLQEINTCLDQNAKLLLAPPDSIFGNGSLSAIFLTGAQDNVCVAVPHPRTLPSIFDYPSRFCDSLKEELSNSALVTECFNNLHRSWTEAELGYDKINSYVGGVCWKKIERHLYSIQHRLPTNYLIHFIPNDLQFFESQICFGAIDHVWPSKLIQEQRERVIGSSDVAFICEVTDPKQNVPPNYPYMKQDPDKFWRNAPHNQFFRQVSVVFRGEECRDI